MSNKSHKHLILGTAGHIDHGKTALIKAMTGIDCDTHIQEKERGITINLGFAHLHLPSGDEISIVDVPGHKDFIHTMVAGASGIDFVLMVIAADSGIMPQTREHLQIMEMLQISHGIIALTKIDLVDDDIIELARDEVVEFTKGTFLENAPIISVSSKTAVGIPQLIPAIEECAGKVSQRPRGEIFRLFIDRIFSKSGFGTIVTGSVISGLLQTGDHAYLLPSKKKLRVRRLERHGEEVQSIVAGDRASLNLVGLEREDFKRGMIIADRILKGTTMIDVRLKMFNHSRTVSLWSNAIFLLGTFEAQVKIHLLGKDSISGGDTVIAQIHLPEECVISAGDRFILRSTSSDITLGGGDVIDAVPLHHRRRPQKLLKNLQKIAEGKLTELIAAEVRKRQNPVNNIEIAEKLNVAPSEIIEIIKDELPDDINAVPINNETAFLATEEIFQHFLKVILNNIKTYHRRNPLEEEGRTTKELLSILGMDSSLGEEDFIRVLLKRLVNEKKLKQVGNTWACIDHVVTISPDLNEKIEIMDKYLQSFGMRVPLASEIADYSSKKGIDQKTLAQVLKYLTIKKRIFRVDGDYIHYNVANNTRLKLLKALSKAPEGFTVAQFRDLLGESRKICLRLFALYDSEGYTLRKGDLRIITERGRKFLQNAG